MKLYFFLIALCFLMNNQIAFSQTSRLPKGNPALAYPAIELSKKIAEQVFIDKGQRYINCPILLDNSWAFPNGSVNAICTDAELACLRYGLLIQKIQTAKGKLLEELKKTLALEKNEVTLRLRGCQLIIEATVPSNNKSLAEAAGYNYDASAPGSNSSSSALGTY